MRTSILLASVLSLAYAAPVTNDAPVIAARAGHAIPGKYIVKMKNDAVSDIINKALAFLDKDPDHVYEFGNYKGFAGELSDNIVKLLQKLPGVRFLSQTN